jgi:23S rRNA (cytidine1920-2'-O)/16S rRNA (cytidine1409-2'-O)-methyltransferase
VSAAEALVSTKTRLDVRLVSQGLAASREKAQALIMAGRVRVDGQPAVKAGLTVAGHARVEVLAGPEHVGRGAVKLAGALDQLGLSPAGRVAVDVGASTGGFTETLLARGAVRVYAIDVGRAQIHERLRQDGRVIVMEGVNARHLSPADVPEPCGIATIDVSFISVLKILPALRTVLAPDADVAMLVKPQFEVGKGRVGRGGIVREAAQHLETLLRVAQAAQREHGYAVRGACASPIAGTEGNREFFLHLKPEGPGADDGALEALTRKAVEP